MSSNPNPKLKQKVSKIKEGPALYNTLQTGQRYKEEVYIPLKTQDLILFGIYFINKQGETCTFERLVAECFLNFPKVFGFMRYSNWPDSLKFDRVLRTLREKGLIVGGAGGRYSPGEFSLTKFGEKIAKEIEAILNSQKPVVTYRKRRVVGRSIDDKLIQYLKNSQQFKNFLNNRESFSLTEPEFRNILRSTLETPQRILRQNLEYYKNLSNLYNEEQLLEFLLLCEKRFLKGGDKNG